MKNRPLGKVLSVLLFQDQRLAIQSIANKEGLKEAHVIRRAVDLYLNSLGVSND